MRNSKLSAHRFKKGKFITPLNEFMTPLSKNDTWYYGRLPEYIWIGLILNKYDRHKGMEVIYHIIKKLSLVDSTVIAPRLSEILKLDDSKQEQFYDFILATIDKQVLSPLTLIFTYSDYPMFAKKFGEPNLNIKSRIGPLREVLSKSMYHQSDFSTDIRFIVLYYMSMTGKLKMHKETLNDIVQYPYLEHSDEDMRRIRPTIRATEVIVLNLEEKSGWYLDIFWGRLSIMTECELYGMKFVEETADTELYMEQLYEIFAYLAELLCKVNPLDDKMLVLFGISTYSYKRLVEVVDHRLFNSISGRGAVRSMIEDYIMMKYLVSNEDQHDNIWSDYQFYGIGQYKLIVLKYREQENELRNSHVDYKYMDMLVNEFVMEESIDMDTRYFNKQNVRKKAEDVGEKALYDLFYDYDSAFEHGLWGAIRESSLLKCNNPSHHYHCVPDVDNNQNLKSVWWDCVNIMEKTLIYLDDLYEIPKHLLKEVIKYGE